MFERFTDRARRTVVLAQEEARMKNSPYIGTEHILLGLIHEGEGVAYLALTKLGITVDTVRPLVSDGEGTPAGHIPFTAAAKKVFEMALRESLQLGHNYIGTEHILLGLVREGEGPACEIIVGSGVSLAGVRTTVVQMLSSYDRQQPTVGNGVLDRLVGFRREVSVLHALAREDARRQERLHGLVSRAGSIFLAVVDNEECVIHDGWCQAHSAGLVDGTCAMVAMRRWVEDVTLDDGQ